MDIGKYRGTKRPGWVSNAAGRPDYWQSPWRRMLTEKAEELNDPASSKAFFFRRRFQNKHHAAPPRVGVRPCASRGVQPTLHPARAPLGLEGSEPKYRRMQELAARGAGSNGGRDGQQARESQVKFKLSPKQRAKPAASRTRTCTNAAVCIASGECPSRF